MSESSQEAVDARKRALLHQIQNRIWSHAVTIRISEIVGDREDDWNTATGTLVFIQDRFLVFTAWHVVKKFVEIRDRGGTPALIIGNHPSLEPRYIFRDESADIAILEVEPHALKAVGAIPYEPIHRWPPPRVVEGDAVMLCGFPALFRNDGAVIEHGDFSFFGAVESASERQFIVQVDPASVMDEGRAPFPDANADLGGISGSPVFVIYPDHMEFVGVFSQSAASAPVWIIRALAALPEDLREFPSQAV
jgi:hypothetical protein